MKRYLLSLCILSMACCQLSMARVRVYLNDGWHFCLGHASDVQKDFGCGTEYFNYLTKCGSIHNSGPYSPSFVESVWDSTTVTTPETWQEVRLPHDWVPLLPYSANASHSHGYQTVGWKYPETSVGWYRKYFAADSVMLAGPTRIVFDGIFRDSRVWVNGFYLGREESGYTRQTYDITPYLNPGDSNLVCVRVDASLEEGWFYEGAGIYRPVWIETGKAEAPKTSPETARYTWSVDSGFLVDGRKVELHGVDLHQDHAGVGIAVPKGLMEYRLRRLQELGVNAIRCSHNPVSEELLDLCDSLGIYVIEETRLMGVNRDQRHVLETMIRRDMHHKCIILWSVGNEEWGIEWADRGEQIARVMTEWVHEIDPSRPSTVATSSGPNIVRGVDIAGYNYIMQNDVDGEHERFPARIALGSEETTGCGARGIYYTDAAAGHMASYNHPCDTFAFFPLPQSGERVTQSAGKGAIIERGWRFYAERPWLAGVFWWTGFDYTGESNPMVWPAVSSQFGLLDLCGFMKDEAYYVQAAWTDTPVLHILPHWNLEGHEGEEVDVWVYSNMDEVELRQDGRSLGRKRMPRYGHLSWTTTYRPGRLEAIGYRKGKKVVTENVYTAGSATQVETKVSAYGDITIIDITLLDKKGHFAATACDDLRITCPEGAEVIGCGNGDPANHITAHRWLGKRSFVYPAFNGHAQIILRGTPIVPQISIQ